jgi:hypothetical protein
MGGRFVVWVPAAPGAPVGSGAGSPRASRPLAAKGEGLVAAARRPALPCGHRPPLDAPITAPPCLVRGRSNRGASA